MLPDAILDNSVDLSTRPSVGGTGPAVLQVLPSLGSGGVERGTLEVARGLSEAGWRPLVASAGGAQAHALDRWQAPHLTLPLASKAPWTVWRNAGRLAGLIERHGIDLVHARSRAPAWSALWAARRTRRPFVTTFHSPYGESPLKHRYNAVMAKGDAVIAISAWLGEHVRRHFPEAAGRLTVIPRGVDLAQFDPALVRGDRIAALAEAWRLEDGRPVVLLPGRLTRWKGQGVLVEAMARLRGSDAVAVLVGADQGRTAYARELAGLIEARGLGRHVRIVSECRDMPAAYLLADVVVSASTDPEGIGRVSAEAPFRVGDDEVSASRSVELWRANRLTLCHNLTGLPSAAVPTGPADGVPMGVQIVAQRYREDMALDAAQAIEDACGVATPIDPMW